MHIKKILAYNLAVLLVAIQVVVVINYWYFIYKKAASASVNQTIDYQGKISGGSGLAIGDGNYNMKFSIYDGLTDGNLLWTETWDNTNQGIAQSQVSIHEGIFSVELNSLCGSWVGSCASNGGVDFNSGTVYLQVELDVDGNSAYEEIFTPRKRFSTAAYSNNVSAVDGSGVGNSDNAIPVLSGTNTWSGVISNIINSANSSALVVVGASAQSENFFEYNNNTNQQITKVNRNGLIESTKINTDSIVAPLQSKSSPSSSIPSVISYWAMDEGSGSVVADRKNTNNGILSNSSWNAQGAFGYQGDDSITFTNSTDNIAAIDNPSLNNIMNGSVEFWVKPNYSGFPIANRGLFSKSGLGSYALFGAYQATNGDIFMNLNEQSPLFLANWSPTADQWYHMVFTWDGSMIKLYIDGIMVGYTAETNGSGTNQGVFYIGSYVYSGGSVMQNFSGAMDNFILYNEALTSKTIRAHYFASQDKITQLPDSNDSSIVGYWQFDEVVYTSTAYDKKANYDGSVYFASRADGGALNYASNRNAVLSGSGSEYIDLGYITELDGVSQFTLSGWAKEDVLDVSEVLLYKYDASDDYIGIETSSDGNMYFSVVNLSGTSRGYFDYSNSISAGTWFSFDMVFDGSGVTDDDKLKVYIDGVQVGLSFDAAIPSTTGSTGSAQLYLGRFSPSTAYDWNGAIDNFIVYSKALTAQEVLSNYNLNSQEIYGIALDVNFSNPSSNDLIQIANNGTSVGAFTTSGQANLKGLNSTGQVILSPDSDISPLAIKSYATQTQNLTEYKNSSSTIVAFVDSLGNLNTPLLETSSVVSTKITSPAVIPGNNPSTSINGIVSYWSMNDGVGTNVNDSVGVHDGTLQNNATFSNTDLYFGNSGDYIVTLDGTDDYINVADNDVFTYGNGSTDSAFSLEGWYKFDAIGVSGLIGKYHEATGSTKREWLLYTLADGSLRGLLYDESAGGYLIREAPASTITTGAWKHIVMTYDGSGIVTGIKLYVNGTQVDTTSYVNGLYTAMENTTQPVSIGSYQDANSIHNEVNGKLDNVIIYNRELGVDEVTAHYNNLSADTPLALAFDTVSDLSSDQAILTSVRTGGNEKLEIKNNSLVFSADANKIVGMERSSVSTGYDLLISPSSATLGGTDLNGGILYLNSGISTGGGSSNIIFQTYPMGSSGNSDNSPVSLLTISGDGSVNIASGKELRFYNGVNYVGFKSPSLSSDTIWSLPQSDGSSSTALMTDGLGSLSFGSTNFGKITSATSSTYTILSDDQVVAVNYNGTPTITLPTPVAGKVLIIKDEGGYGGITVVPSVSETIDGASNVIINAFGKLSLVSDGTNWFSF